MAQDLILLTPEKTVLSFRLSGIGSRVLAHLLDAIIVIAGVVAILMLASLLAIINIGLTTILGGVTLTLGWLAYFWLLEGLWNGQTIGKKAVGIRVRMADGTPVTLLAAFGRNVVRIADFLPAFYPLGLCAMFTNTKSQRLGDMVANTIVVHERRALPTFTPAPYALGIHPFEAHVGELRGMTNEEYLALKQLCDRFPQLPVHVQEHLIHQVWDPMAEKLKVQPLANVHPVYLAEAVVMKYGRSQGML